MDWRLGKRRRRACTHYRVPVAVALPRGGPRLPPAANPFPSAPPSLLPHFPALPSPAVTPGAGGMATPQYVPGAPPGAPPPYVTGAPPPAYAPAAYAAPPPGYGAPPPGYPMAPMAGGPPPPPQPVAGGKPGGGGSGSGAGAPADVAADMEYGTTVDTSMVNVRLGFIRKVFTIVALQLAMTVALGCLFIFVVPLREWVIEHPWVMLGIGIGGTLAFLLPLYCGGLKNKYPINMLLLAGFTASMSFLIGSVCASYYESGAGIIVLEAAVCTFAVLLTLTTYVLITKKDFSYLGGFLGAALMVLIVASIANFALGIVGARSKLFSWAISILGALVFTGYLLYDLSRVVTRLSPDEYIQGAISIYLDTVNLFLFMLNIFGLASN